MSASILTNNSAMIALQNLRSTNQSLSDVNSQISTGKKVATAKDNAAVFAISAVMESDVSGFKAISESLSLGGSTVAVASNGAKQVGAGSLRGNSQLGLPGGCLRGCLSGCACGCACGCVFTWLGLLRRWAGRDRRRLRWRRHR